MTTFPEDDCPDTFVDFPCPHCGYAFSRILEHP